MSWPSPANRSRPSNSRIWWPLCETTSRWLGSITNSVPVIRQLLMLTGLSLASCVCLPQIYPILDETQVTWERMLDGVSVAIHCEEK